MGCALLQLYRFSFKILQNSPFCHFVFQSFEGIQQTAVLLIMLILTSCHGH